jgi:hypothetical protein
VLGGSAVVSLADATSDAFAYALVASLFALTLATLIARRPAEARHG